MPGLGELTVDLVANIARFERALNKAERIANKRAAGIKRTFVRLAATLGVTLGSLGFARAIDGALDFADSIDKAAERAGISARKLQELRFAADQTGISTQQLDDAMRRFTRRLGVALGGGSFAKDFERLGVSIFDAAGNARSSEAVFNDVAAAMGNLETQAQRSSFAAQLFGDDAGPQLSLLLKGGQQAISDYADEANRLGLIMDDDLVKRSVESKDRLSQLSQAFSITFNSALLSVVPTIEKVANGVASVIDSLARTFGDVETIPIDALDDRIAELEERLKVKRQNLEEAIADQQDEGFFNKLFGISDENFEILRQKLEDQITQLEGDILIARERLTEAQRGGEAGGGEIVNPFNGMTEAEMDRAVAIHNEHAEAVAEIDRQLAEQRKQAAAQVQTFVENTEANIANHAISLLRTLGQKRKEFAQLAIIIQKARAIQEIKVNTQVASILAFASQLIPGDPTSLARAEAAREAVLALGTTSALLVAATGLAELAQTNADATAGGGGVSPSGSSSSPFTTTPSADSQTFEEAGTQGTLVINVNGVITEEILQDLMIPAIQGAVNDRDVILIRNDSQNALNFTELIQPS